jgi:hypothetical protein
MLDQKSINARSYQCGQEGRNLLVCLALKASVIGRLEMTLLIKTATVALIATTVTVSCFAGHADAAPLSSPLALRDAIAPTLQTVGWRGRGFRGGWGGGWRGGWGGRYGGWGGVGVGIAAGALIGGALASGPYYGYNYGYYAPSYYGSYAPAYYDDEYAPAYYGGYAPAYYGGYSYAPYYRSYRYAPRFYGGYGLGYRHVFLRHRAW